MVAVTEGKSGPQLDPETVAVGNKGPSIVVEDLDREDFVRYAGASGDFNPVHYDEPFAKQAGYESVFAPGMLIAGIASRFVTDWIGIGTLEAFSTRFAAQVWPGDTLTVDGEIISVDHDEMATAVDIEFTVHADSEVVLTGTATAAYPECKD